MVGYDDTYLEFAENDDRLSSVGRNICEDIWNILFRSAQKQKQKGM